MENQSYFKVEYSNEKKFGYLFSLIFFIIAVYPFFFNGNIRIWSLIVSIIFLFLSLKYSKLLIIPNRIWLKLGIFLNKIVSPIIMLLIFIITFFPIGIIIKILRIDLINQKINPKKKSYWINRMNKMESLKKLY